MSQMLKSSGAMGIATMTSRILGLVREQVYYWFMGTGAVASAFVFAFTIPNLFRRLLGEGALTAAFIPIFKSKEKTDGEAEMWRAANAVISGLIVASVAVVVAVMIGVTIFLATATLQPNTRLMLELLRTMFPYMILVCLAAILMGMLNARGHFFVPAFGSVVLNVVMIGSVVFLVPFFGNTLEKQIFAVAVGVLIAGVMQAIFQVPTLRAEGFRYRWVSPWKDPTVREVVRKMIPGSIGVAAFQINVLLTQTLAFGENESIVAVFNGAVRLMELPQGVFGISLATYLLPTLSGLAAEKKFPEFRSTLRQGLSYLIYINILASVFLFVLAEPIIRLLFERGKFTAFSTQQVSFALVCLAPGLVAFSMVNILARAFYAVGDIKTPMKISLFCLAVNFGFAMFFLFILNLGAAGLGIANTISSACNVTLLLFALRKKLKQLDFAELVQQLVPVIASAIAAGLLAWCIRYYWQTHLGHAKLAMKLGEVFVPMIFATLLYFGLTSWLKIPSAHDVLNLVMRRLPKKS
ncbi:MAG: putative lipid flippase MurJ [Verrucomicrobiales bacterium]|nr:putative lipid flippase MurJ [Verrucomicrobiales bacterium]